MIFSGLEQNKKETDKKVQECEGGKQIGDVGVILKGNNIQMRQKNARSKQ